LRFLCLPVERSIPSRPKPIGVRTRKRSLYFRHPGCAPRVRSYAMPISPVLWSQILSHRGKKFGTLLLAGSLLLLAQWPALAAYDAVSKQGVDLSGHWKLNAAASDDAEAMMQKRIAEEAKRRAAYMKRAREEGAFWLPPPEPPGEPEGEAPPGGKSDAKPDAKAGGEPPGAGRPGERPRGRSRRYDGLRQMLGISNTLDITQSGTKVDIVSQVESRRFEAGVNSQVSMPGGELADSHVGWDGQWFVIERKASGGPRVTEKYRLLKKTDQLESVIAWGGDSPLAGIKVHRLFDRGVADTTPPNPEDGPIR